ncbi:thiamine phosphate synthase [Pectinatus cerevisiiphilus]|uniref:Thiamine-phosphate synthase n=1 Tax=Pectinatus cerevisiiphilus TaxID=86956 RepID=A0A4R3KE79_9FIRM|nr:thiamine phosphate synthase [Pectinatus cerevisiiphilus]TCS81395.1 thiamine-phosphate diphosphorylase [Pectinatus cerevisiiphilus]
MNLRAGMESFFNTGIYGITAEKVSNGRNNIEVVREMLDGGIKFIQYREKEKDALSRYEECLILRDMVKQAGGVFIIDDFIDLAIAVNADGVHIGQSDLPPNVVRKMLGNGKLIGLSTHSVEELDRANELKKYIDYIGVGPIHATPTKKEAVPVGFSYLDYAVKNSQLPLVAIGGIKEHNIDEIIDAGVKTVAVVSDIVGADNIKNKVQRLRKKIFPDIF